MGMKMMQYHPNTCSSFDGTVILLWPMNSQWLCKILTKTLMGSLFFLVYMYMLWCCFVRMFCSVDRLFKICPPDNVYKLCHCQTICFVEVDLRKWIIVNWLLSDGLIRYADNLAYRFDCNQLNVQLVQNWDWLYMRNVRHCYFDGDWMWN